MDGLKTTEKDLRPRIVLHGEEKIGKSSFCAQFSKPFFLNFEDGLEYIAHDYLKNRGEELARTPKINNIADARTWIDRLEKEDHDYDQIVVDSIDWFENLAKDELCKKFNATDISDKQVKEFAYGAAYEMISVKIRGFLNALDNLNEAKGMQPILIAHSSIKSVNNPLDPDHEKFVLKLEKKSTAAIKEWADIIMMARKEFFVTNDGKASDPVRMLYCGNHPSFEGGSRMNLPQKIPFDYKTFNEALKGE